MNFIVGECTFLRYFIPLTIEGNSRGIQSNYFILSSGKYNCPVKHKSTILELSKKYNFNVHDIRDVKSYEGITFLIEGVGINHLNDKHKKLSLTYTVDFVDLYNSYKDKADYIIMPSKFMKDFYGYGNVDKVVPLGSPKYQVELSPTDILPKYDLSQNEKYALVVYPMLRDLSKVDMNLIYQCLRDKGYKVIVKARGKEKAKTHTGDHYFLDRSWHPHTTMELAQISDIIINFGSTGNKEFVMLKRPMLNFDVQGGRQISIALPFLHNYDYCINHSGNFFNKNKNHRDIILKNIDYLANTNFDSEYEKSINAHLKECRNACENIFSFIEKRGLLK